MCSNSCQFYSQKFSRRDPCYHYFFEKLCFEILSKNISTECSDVARYFLQFYFLQINNILPEISFTHFGKFILTCHRSIPAKCPISKHRSIILKLCLCLEPLPEDFVGDASQLSSSTTKRARYAIPRKWNVDVPTFKQAEIEFELFSGGRIRRSRKGWYFKSPLSFLWLTLGCAKVHTLLARKYL